MFFLSIALVVLLGHVYLYFRLVCPLVRSTRVRRLIGLAFAAVTALVFLRRPVRARLPQLEASYEIFVYSYFTLGLSLMLALAAMDGVRLIASLYWKIRSRTADEGAEAHSPQPGTQASVGLGRRELFQQATGVAALAGGVGLAAYGSASALIPPSVTETVIPVKKLPRALDGFTIVQLTDIHVGSFIKRGFIDELVARSNATQPDLVAITGDLVDGNVAALGNAVAGLGHLSSRYGTYFVTGNHEYYAGVDPWVRFLGSLGIDVLRNRRVVIGDAGGSFDLVGVDDWSGAQRRGGQGYDLEAALRGRDPERAAVLLAHQPTNFEAAVEGGVDLQVSGHTHGGQFFPMSALVGLRYEFTRGLYRRGDNHIFVSRGCGFWGPPDRAGSLPEIAKLVLTAA